jgi:hypothetical protein
VESIHLDKNGEETASIADIADILGTTSSMEIASPQGSLIAAPGSVSQQRVSMSQTSFGFVVQQSPSASEPKISHAFIVNTSGGSTKGASGRCQVSLTIL